MNFETQKKIGHYEIREKIGAGGMGEVYLAEDTRLKRSVALKLLPADFSQNKDRLRRFEQEARAASALNHPNIAHIYEIGESEGVNFIAMEFVEGETLREKIHAEKVDLRTLLKYLAQVADGLAKAHAAGIVHRDLKPDNIMISRDGFAKILDFGLAKLTKSEPPAVAGGLNDELKEAATAMMPPPLSAPGMIMGTAGYMSPEQAQGKKGIDQRSDIFSFGCVLYEAATRQQPFAGETVIDSLHKIIHAPTPPIRDFNADAPSDLQRILRRCLQKDPEERYQTIKDVAIELKELRREMKNAAEVKISISPEITNASRISKAGDETISVGEKTSASTAESVAHSTSSAEYVVGEIKRHKRGFVAGLIVLLLTSIGLGYWFFSNRSANIKQIESIAVMPFVNESGNADNEYLSDGMTESLINSLSQLPKLSVKARSSVFRYKGKDIEPQTVGNELSVQAILNGRVAQRGENLTLSLELVDTKTGNQIWGEQYNRKQTDLISLQSEIARDVLQKLRARLSGADQHRAMKTYTQNPEAYQLYLQGLYHWHKRTPEDIRKSIVLFRQATEKDPSYAQAYASLALAYSVLPSNSAMTNQEAKDIRLKERAALNKAQELDDSLAEVHLELATFKRDDWDFAAAEKEFKRAIELNPNYATARQWYSEFLSGMGRHEEAFAQINKAHEIDPFSRAVNANIGLRLTQARRFDEAIAQYKKVIEMEPNYPIVHSFLAHAYEAKGMNLEAIAEIRVADILLEKDSTESSERKAAAFTQALQTGGAQGYWQKHLELSLKEYEQGYETAFGIAVNYARLGDNDRTFEWLEKSFAAHEEDLVSIKAEPAFDGLSTDLRFQDLLRRVGLSQ